jgi:ATP-dependent DNA ligase
MIEEKFELANPTEKPPSNIDQYFIQLKKDGERCHIIKKGKNVEIWNRDRKTNAYGNLKNIQYPEVVEEMLNQEGDFVIDGEMCCADLKNGLRIFNKRALATDPLKISILVTKIPIRFYAFDILEKNGKDLRKLSLIDRYTELLGTLQMTDHIAVLPLLRSFEDLWDRVVKEGLEGVMFKKANSVYIEKRTDDWLKMKQSFVEIVNVLGYDQTGKRSKFGSLLTDHGRVNLKTEENKKEYFDRKPMKAEVKYFEKYPSGKLRNPDFIRFVENGGED